MASPSQELPSTGVVALEFGYQILSIIIIIIEDRAADIPYSADALDRLTKLLPRTSKIPIVNNQEACALYYSIVEDLNRLPNEYEIYNTILREKGKVLVSHKKEIQKLLKVQNNVERLLILMMEKEQQEEEEEEEEEEETSRNATEGGVEDEGVSEEHNEGVSVADS